MMMFNTSPPSKRGEAANVAIKTSMNVRDIMTADPITIKSTQSLRSALEIMEDHEIHHLPVISQGGHLVGVISDRDCRQALDSPYIERDRWQRQDLVRSLQIRTIMSAAPIIVEPYTSASESARLMLQHNIGCLPVMRSETLIGIITRSDILMAFMNIHRHYEGLIDTSVPQPVIPSGSSSTS